MAAFIFRRLVSLVFVLFCVVTITFFSAKLMVGGPFARERKLPEQIEKNLEAKYGLDKTGWQQYRHYVWYLLHGDLGISLRYRNRSVNELLGQTLPVSAILGGVAFLIATTAGVWIGAYAAVRHGTPEDTIAMLGALLAISAPVFVIGPILILIFSLWLHWLPVGGWNGLGTLILPAVTLASPFVAYVARLMRTSMLEVLGLDFIRTAKAKGLPERRIIFKHALKVAILPVVSFLGPLAANLLTGSVVVETIFNIPGAGGFFVNSILNKDGFLLGGVTIVYCSLLVVMNLIVDLIYMALDRRIRLYD